MTIPTSCSLEAKQIFRKGLTGGKKAEGVRKWNRIKDSLKVVFTQDVTLLKPFPLQMTQFLYVSAFSSKSTAGHNKATFASWILAWLVTTGICYLELLSLSPKKCTGSLSCSSTVRKHTCIYTHLPTMEDVCAGEWCSVCVGRTAVMSN